MDRRALKNLITKRSTIWTLSLCLTGALVLGGIAIVDNSRDSAEDTQLESDLGELAYLEEDYTSDELSGENETENTAEASGTAIEDGISTDDLSGTTLDESVDAVTGTSDLLDGTTDLSDGTGTDDSAQIADSDAVAADGSDVYSDSIISEQALLDAGIEFTEEDTLMWPSAGTILIDYSMDGTVYFPTLNQYKYNPALIIGSETGNQVIASAKGMVESIAIDEETGTTLVLNIGNGYKLTYGQLKELAVAEGDVVEQGTLLGYVSEPTKYYSTEGSNLYFAMTQDEAAVDPVLYLE